MGATGQTGVWGFENIGGAMAVIDNPSLPIGEWSVRQIDLPFTKDALRDQGLAEKRAAFVGNQLGMSCVKAEQSGKPNGSTYLYVYGDQHRKYKDRQLWLQESDLRRSKTSANGNFFPELRAGSEMLIRLSRSPMKSEQNSQSRKLSFRARKNTSWSTATMFHSHHLMGTGIFIRTADAPEGPWSKPKAVYDVPDVKKSKNYFTYAARGHAMASPEGQLLITYIVNSNDFWEMAADASIYRPRCITVPLELVFGWK